MNLRLISSEHVTSDVHSFYFENYPSQSWTAGQFIEYRLPHENTDDRGDKRWFTIASAPHENRIQITTRLQMPSSSFKQALAALKSGDYIEAKEPEGDFAVNDPQQQHVFIAGGIGITPFRSILADLHYRGDPLNVTLLYVTRSADSIAFKAELNALDGEHPEMDIQYIHGKNGLTESLIRDFVPVLEEPIFYVSGPEPMVESLGNLLDAMGIPKDHLKQDFFPHYSAKL